MSRKKHTYKEPFTRGRAVPGSGSRTGCLCPDGKSYHVDCCGQDALAAQGIGQTMALPPDPVIYSGIITFGDYFGVFAGYDNGNTGASPSPFGDLQPQPVEVAPGNVLNGWGAYSSGKVSAYVATNGGTISNILFEFDGVQYLFDIVETNDLIISIADTTLETFVRNNIGNSFDFKIVALNV